MSMPQNWLRIREQYAMRFAKSRPLAEKARGLFPGGVTHDLRSMDPFPVYFDRAEGCRKWDIQGNSLIDYWSGHGSMILGHSQLEVVRAVQEQMTKSTHAGGCHEGEIIWGELVRQLIPCAERVRFTGSGTEATMMAIRLARIYTGRNKFLKFAGHFHGWHDAVAPGSDAPYDQLRVPGIPDEIAKATVVIPPNDLNLVESTLKNDPEIGAVILEPTGGHWGAVPIRGEFLKGLRELTQKYGQVLIFDEVITGFRVSPGGAQAYYNVLPDMTSLAKILAGGLPGGCLVGRADVMASLETRPGKAKMRHPGTYNANPLSAAAGITTLKKVATGEPTQIANELARSLRNQLNQLFEEQNWPWVAYTDFSMFRLLPDYTGPRPKPATTDNDGPIPYEGELNRLDGPKNMPLIHAFKQALMLHGVDMPSLGGWLTAAHTQKEIDQTVAAIGRAIEMITS